MPATKKEVEFFLKEFRAGWPKTGYTVIDREKNDDALGILGITPDHRQNIILSLTYKDYVAGPENDKDGSSGEVWKFTKKVRSYQIYIKLKIFKVKDKTYAKCMSFHPDLSNKLEGGSYV